MRCMLAPEHSNPQGHRHRLSPNHRRTLIGRARSVAFRPTAQSQPGRCINMSTDADCGRASQLLAGLALGMRISRRPPTEEGMHGKTVCGTTNDKRPEAKRQHGVL